MMICTNCGTMFDPNDIQYECDFYMDRDKEGGDEEYEWEIEYESLCPCCKSDRRRESITWDE